MLIDTPEAAREYADDCRRNASPERFKWHMYYTVEGFRRNLAIAYNRGRTEEVAVCESILRARCTRSLRPPTPAPKQNTGAHMDTTSRGRLITTRHLYPTNHRGFRIVATSLAKRVVLAWDHGLSDDQNHTRAALECLYASGWGDTYVISLAARAHDGTGDVFILTKRI